jgi:hypothetical protein
MSRTREAPTPTNISTKSEPEIEKNGTLASPAMALASSVLPVPGGRPSARRAGSCRRASGTCRVAQELDQLADSSLASSTPATSAKVTLTWSPRYTSGERLREAAGLRIATLS